jgi:SAM-dependent methyltransferase
MAPLSSLVSLLRCLDCTEPLKVADLVNPGGYPELGADGILECTGCTARYPIVAGTVRMLRKSAIAELARDYPCSVSVLQQAVGKDGAPSADFQVKQRTAESFAYEWSHFGQLREAYGQNFLGYMQPHSADFFSNLLLLDIGCGSGRHSYEAAKLGARVVAVDLGRSIDVARRNLPLEVLTVQADAELLPFKHSAFDFVMSIGVLHHLPNTERAFLSIIPYARAGGFVHVYLYGVPRQVWQQRLLALISLIRRVTVRLPHRVLHPLCYPLAAIAYGTFVLPYRVLRRIPAAHRLADCLPLKAYADYPFGMCVNDQFDRFSAPLERRFTYQEVKDLLDTGGLVDPVILPNSGWLGSGRRSECAS